MVWYAGHQRHVDRIRSTIAPIDGLDDADCVCIHVSDVHIQFPNGLKRPDISIFCREPDEAEQEGTLTLIPEAVNEVVSRGFEAKDLEIGPPFYLSQGVKDVVVFDPATIQNEL